jgi:protein gp37
MGRKTGISWATLGLPEGATANPIRAVNKETGDEGHMCVRVNGRCRQCYSSRFNEQRFRGILGTGLGFSAQNLKQVDILWKEKHAAQVWGWTKPTGVFWADMTDYVGEWVPAWMRYRMFAYATLAKQHRHAFLTKRPQTLLDLIVTGYRQGLSDELLEISALHQTAKKHKEIIGALHDIQDGFDPFTANNWLWGVTIGHQDDMDQFKAILHEIKQQRPTIRLWVSYEPAHGPVNWWPLYGVVDWIVGGGESRQEPDQPLVQADESWFISTADWCTHAGVPYYHKQMGTLWAEKHHVAGKADHPAEWPEALRVREFPRFEPDEQPH